MLIRAATPDDIASCRLLFPNLSKSIDDGTKSQIHLYQIFMAEDRLSKKALGIVVISRELNGIGYLGVTGGLDYQFVGRKLLDVALNQLDNTRNISTYVPTEEKNISSVLKNAGFITDTNDILKNGQSYDRMSKSPTMKKGYSFHYDYAGYLEWMDESKCPFCSGELLLKDHVLIKELKYSSVLASEKAQGALWGKCHIVSRKHFIELHDMPKADLAGFMHDVQTTARALKEISGAVKINLEQHGNTIPHLHFHLYPRYLDDFFAGKAIDYSITEPSPYENKVEFDYFIEQMREKLSQ